MVQKIYIGCYQRPADPGGLIHWADRLQNNGGNVGAIIEEFANSDESRTLYGTINTTNISAVVNNIYHAFFNRDADAEDVNNYSVGFNSGQFTAATIMLNVLAGAENEDRASIDNKLTAAHLFTRTVAPPEILKLWTSWAQFVYVTYDGQHDWIAARNFLNFVTSDPKTIPTQEQTATYIVTNIADAGDMILGNCR
jgi:hypothetical protein